MFKELRMMKKTLYIIIICCIATSAFAQTYLTSPATDPAIQSQKLMTSGASYEGTIYEPFSNTTPSEYLNGMNSTTDEPYTPRGPRKGFDIGGDTGQGPSPIGDAVLPLLLCAAAFCGVIYFRRKHATR